MMQAIDHYKYCKKIPSLNLIFEESTCTASSGIPRDISLAAFPPVINGPANIGWDARIKK